MPLHYTAAASSRITKSRITATNKRSPLGKPKRPVSTKSQSLQKRKTGKATAGASASTAVSGEDDGDGDYDDDDPIPDDAAAPFSEPLPDAGLLPAALAANPALRSLDAARLIAHIRSRMFAAIPDRAAGMRSTRIATVLRFRAALPPAVSVAHACALSASPTRTEREIAALVAAGAARRVRIARRGVGGRAVGEAVVLAGDWEAVVRADAGLDDAVREEYLGLLRANPGGLGVPASAFAHPDTPALLVRAGLLTHSPGGSAAAVAASSTPFRPAAGKGGLGISTAGSKAASGSLAAVGGAGAVHVSGGTGGGRLSLSLSRSDIESRGASTAFYSFALPSMGPYLKLLVDAREHLLTLLQRASPRHREAPLEWLRERWDGGSGEGMGSEIVKAKRARGEWTGVLPGRTKKWRVFWGVEFDWVLGECVGAGMVECFQTGSVGVGVRAVR